MKLAGFKVATIKGSDLCLFKVKPIFTSSVTKKSVAIYLLPSLLTGSASRL